MLVQLQFGSRAGEVVDFLPHEARAMLADGRAVAVSDDDAVPPVPVGVATDRMADVVRPDPVSRPTQARRRRR